MRDGRDGRALIDELERSGDALPEGSERSTWLYELARAAEELVPERGRALALHRRAWEQDREHHEAARAALELSRQLGRLEDTVFIAGWELESEPEPARQAEISSIIAEALLDLGERQRAVSLLVSAVAMHPESQAIQDALATVGYDDDWRAETRRLIAVAADPSTQPGDAARVYLRAARIYGMEAPEDPEYATLLGKVLERDPHCASAHYLYEAHLAAAQRWDDLAAIEWRRVESTNSLTDAADLCVAYAFAWSERYRDRERAAGWIVRAMELGHLLFPVASLTVLRDHHAARREWRVLTDLIDEVLALDLDADAVVHAALLGGTVAWKALGDLDCARVFFARVREHAPESLLVAEFDDGLIAAAEPNPLSGEQRALIQAAQKVPASEPPERALDAWKKAIAVDATRRAPRRGLARVLRRAERWRALAEALKEEEAQACTTDEQRVTVLLELAAVYRDRLHHDLLVATTLQRVIELDAQNGSALDQLATHYEAMRRWPEALATLAKRAQIPTEPAAQAALFKRAADIALQKLSNEPEAIKALEGALALTPDDDGALAELSRLYEKRREWEKRVALEQKRLARLPASTRLPALLELARTAAEKIKRAQPAIELYREALLAGAPADETLDALEKLHTREQDWPRLAEVLAERAERTTDPAQKVSRLSELALVYSTRLEDTERAASAWRAVLALQPGHLRAQDGLRRLLLQRHAWADLEALHLQQGRPDECVRVFERQVELPELDTAARVELWVRIGGLARDHMARPERAQRAFERALELDPKSRGAAEGLIPFYQHLPAKLSQVLAVALEHVTGADERRPRLRRLAALAESLNESRAAFDWWRRALEEEPAAEDAPGAMLRLAEAADAFVPLIESFRNAAKTLSPAGALPLLAQVARTLEGPLHDSPAALLAWRDLLALDADNLEALDALERLLLAARDFVALREVYERKLERAPDAAARRYVQYQIAHLAEEQGDDDRAAEAYQALLEAGGDALPELEALDRIYTRRGASLELMGVLARETRLATGESRNALLLRLAELTEQQGDATGAFTLYREVLANAPADATARAALERRLADPALKNQAAALLETVYERAEAWDALIAAREVLAESGADDRKVELNRSIAALHQKLGRPDAAFESLARALRINPTDPPTVADLEAHADATQGHAALLALYKEIASRPLGIDEQIDLRCRIGRRYRAAGELERAIATFQRVLDLRNSPEARAALEELYGLGRRWPELEQLLSRRIESAQDDAAAWAQLGELRERHLQNPNGAFQAFRHALGIEPAHPVALAGMERLFQQGIAGELPPSERLLVHLYLGELHQTRGEVERAEPCFRRALAIAPEARAELPPTARLKIARLERDLAKNVESARALFRSLLDGGGEALRVEVVRELARLEAGEEAIPAWRRLLEAVPDDPEALDALELHLRAAGRTAELIEIVELKRRLAPPDAQRPLLLRLLPLLRAAGQPDRARALLDEALSVAPEDLELVRALLAHLRETRETAELARAIEKLLALPIGRAEQIALLTELGSLESDVLDRAERALAVWQRLLALEPQSVPALIALEALYARDGRRRDQLEMLTRRAALARDDKTRLQLALDTGALWDQEGEPARAATEYEKARALAPAHPVASTQLEAYYTRLADWPKLISVLDDRAHESSDPIDHVALLGRIARLREERLNDRDGAFAALLDALAVERRFEPLAEELERLAQALGRESALAEAVELHAAAEPDRSRRIELYLALGGLREREGGEPLAAINAYRSALDLDSSCALALSALERLYRRALLPGPLAGVLERKADLTLDGDSRLVLYGEAATLRAEAGQWERAADAERRAAENDPSPLGRGRRLFAAGLLLRERVRDAEAALHCFEQALDAYAEGAEHPAADNWLKVIEAIDGIAAERADWRVLERSYKRVLDHLPQRPGDAIAIVLWKNLGELYRSRLADTKAAERAFEIAASLSMT